MQQTQMPSIEISTGIFEYLYKLTYSTENYMWYTILKSIFRTYT